MPFINGRYHVNPAMGQALEAAREAEAALLALQQQARRNSGDASTSAPGDDSADPENPSAADAQPGDGPIHHVEIEATEVDSEPFRPRHARLRRPRASRRAFGFRCHSEEQRDEGSLLRRGKRDPSLRSG